MLLADKHNFRQAMKLRLLHIEEKELAYYTQNCYAMGTRAAVLILFSLSGFTQVDSTMLDDNKVMNHLAMQGFWTGSCVLAAILEIMTLIKCMQLTIMGNRLALLGGEGSMTRAVLIMRSEYLVLQRTFYMGLVVFHIATCLYVWNHWREEVGAFVTVVIACALLYLWYDSRQLARALSIPTQGHGSSWDEGAEEGADVLRAQERRNAELAQTPRGDAAGASVSAPQLRRPGEKASEKLAAADGESVSAPQLRRGVGPGAWEERPGGGLKRRPTQAGQGTWRDFANSKQMVDMEIVGAEARGGVGPARTPTRRKLPSVLKRTATGEIDEAATQEAVLAMFRPSGSTPAKGSVATPSSAGAKLGEGRSAAWNRAGLSALAAAAAQDGQPAAPAPLSLRERMLAAAKAEGEAQTPTPTVPLSSVRPGSPLAMRLERAKGK